MPVIFPSISGTGKPQPRTRLNGQGGINSRCIGAWLLGEGGPHWFDSAQQNRTLGIYDDGSANGTQLAPWNKGRLGGASYRGAGLSRNYVKTDKNYSPPPGGNLTANVWAYTLAFANYQPFICQWNEAASLAQWVLWAFGDGTVHISSSSNGVSVFHREDGPALSLQTWNMVTGVWPASGGTMLIYVNGKIVATTGAGNEAYSGFLNASQPIYFGYSPGLGGLGKCGNNVRMEAASVWERVLSAEEIAGLYRDQFRQWERPRLTRSLGGIIVPPSYHYSLSPRGQRAVYLRQ